MWKRLNNISSKISWSFGGNLIYALSQWIIITVIARFGSTTELGIYSLGLAITAPIVLFFSFQLRTILATDSKQEYDFSQYFGGRIIHLTISLVIIIPIAFLYSSNVENILVIILLGIIKCVEGLSDICMGFYQKKSKIDIIGKSQMYRGIFSVIVVFLIYFFTQNLIFSQIGLLIIMVIRLVIYDLKNLRPFVKIFPVFDLSWIHLMKWAFPLGIASLISSLNTNIPRYFLEYFSSTEEVGIFSALYYILIASNMLITPISLLAAPRIARAYNQNQIKKYTKINIQLSLVSLILFLLIITIIIFQGELILKVLYGSAYTSYNDSFIIISCSLLFGFLTAFYTVSIVAARSIRIQPLLNFMVTIVTIISCYYFIGTQDILGASYSLLISRIFQALLSAGLLFHIIYKKSR
ncbi:oligosaccharide flippase family protein [Peribacillus frigoritolerans]|uniref:lipopolysaccharide biosynthesis protein n=1 Tax=Peribacillus frigoritolerans TaxID=450367 RepID=UPI002ED65283|nr:oligosaccharide flippase family protein [Peribacillus frigoritolerans]